MDKEIAVGMALRDLMSATLSLSEIPIDLIKLEYEDIELVHARIERLLKECYAAS